jgi:hypothetical protein
MPNNLNNNKYSKLYSSTGATETMINKKTNPSALASAGRFSSSARRDGEDLSKMAVAVRGTWCLSTSVCQQNRQRLHEVDVLRL